MKINRAYKVELKPNNVQQTFFNKSVGVARLAYNWGLNLSIEQYKSDNKSKFLGAIGLHKELNKLKKDKFNFMYEVSKQVPQNALRDLDTAFTNFFRAIKKGNNKVGFPKFKSKKGSKQSFRIDGDSIKITSTHIKLPKIGLVRLKEHGYIPTIESINDTEIIQSIKYTSATVSKEVDRWFVSVSVEIEQNTNTVLQSIPEEILGIDLGIKELATCSNQQVFSNPKNTRRYQKKLSREQRRLSRKKKGSKNRNKQIIRVAKVHKTISNSRLDNLHKMTSDITKTKCRIVVLEDLNVSGMMKNHKLSKALSDSSFSEIRRQLEYKTIFYGGEVFIINKWYPSSKKCSKCGSIKDDLTLKDRVYQCVDVDCEYHLNPIDRDLNASYNIQDYYIDNVINVVNKVVEIKPVKKKRKTG